MIIMCELKVFIALSINCLNEIYHPIKNLSKSVIFLFFDSFDYTG